ncbi:Uu.00g134470.m01.CDS01 [Anthostomella pinea]|uniref:Uu.00g134470.m01.CDS01 n=1 Tax=Anthostomella pinea TaxID=933095 RepID=A0AAI8VNY2_9PEZI|nr:Uu.00g134470.m01.CDS01 [Anthostomella pinea]
MMLTILFTTGTTNDNSETRGLLWAGISRAFCGPRPQPDYGLGFKREAFTHPQLQKLEPFIGNVLRDCSYFAATYDMFLPFLTSEVKCGAGALDVADRQNAHSQVVALRGLVELFRLVGRETELHRQINGFSVSHSDEYVRIWGHYAVIDGQDVSYFRHPIAKFDISPTAEGDQRWKAYSFVRNVQDLWVPDHFTKICSVIDALPTELSFDDDFGPSEGSASRSGLSQELDCSSLVDEQATILAQGGLYAHPVSPNTTMQSTSTTDPMKRRRNQ